MQKLLILLSLFLVFPAHASLPDPSLNLIPTASRDFRANLSKLAKKSGPIGDYFKLKLAEKKIINHASSEALKISAHIAEPLFAFWKSVVRAEAYLDLGKTRESLASIKKLPIKPDPKISYGESQYANIYKRALLVRYFASKALGRNTRKLASALVSLYPLDKTINELFDEKNYPKLSLTNKLDKLHNLFASYKFKEIPGVVSVNEIKKSKLSKEKKCLSFYELASALKSNKAFKEESVRGFSAMLPLKCEKQMDARALYWLGSIYLPNNSLLPDEREKHLTKLYQKYPKHRLADDAVYKLHKIAVKKGDSSKVKKYYKMLAGLKSGDMRMKYFFDSGYAHYKKGKYKKAASLLKTSLNAESTFDETYPRSIYWYARTLEKQALPKTSKESKQAYARLLKEFPFSFYAVLASKRSGIPLKTPKLPRLSGKSPENGWEYFALVDEFLEKGHHEPARFTLNLALHKHPDWMESHKHFITKKLISVRNYRKALDLASVHFGSGVYGPIKVTDDPMFAAFYPWAFKDKAKIGYVQSKLPFGAIEGIMREESLFQHNAKSWVGATGLMQLMPTTAKFVRKKLPAHLNMESDLTDVETNILLGSSYLSSMKSYFDDQLPLAIMAYNAGPGNVRKWLRKFGTLELDEFIENIPFSETRGYVKRVMRTMQVYGSLYREPFFKSDEFVNFEIILKNKKK
jgi:tetratricopeptide (TPR) repeat protein